MYRTARDKKQQIQILAQLNECKESEICDILDIKSDVPIFAKKLISGCVPKRHRTCTLTDESGKVIPRPYR